MLLFIVIWYKRGYFNTSHVTVYPFSSTNKINFIRISIHPMLLFIPQKIFGQPTLNEFQYIPCYCLSGNVKNQHAYLSTFQYIPCYCLS